jgi:hypothetical protein
MIPKTCKQPKKNYSFAGKGDTTMAFPKSQAEINALLQIWLVKLPNWAILYGLSNETVKQAQDDAIVYKHILDITLQFESDRSELSSYRENMFTGNPTSAAAAYPEVTLTPLPTLAIGAKPGIQIRNKVLFNFLKAHPSRTTESLSDLGILTASPPKVAAADLRPSLKVSAKINDRVEIAFGKQGQNAMRVQMRRGTFDWLTVGDPTSTPFIDNTASIAGNPEKREYRGVFLQKNETVGQFSDIASVVTTP